MSRSNLQCSWRQRLPSQTLAEVLMMWLFFHSVTSVAPLIQITGEVGGSVTFFCPSHKDKMLTLLYLQKGTTFVNGYHSVRDAQIYSDIRRSHVNHIERTVDMWALKVSDSGEYSCHVQYSDNMKLDETRIYLSVTANYSTPTLSAVCDDDASSCQVTCASHGGYPSSEVMWNSSTNANSQWWMPGNSSKEADPDSMLINSSSTVNINCSGPLQSLSCSVGGFTSENLTVCKRKIPSGQRAPYWIAIGCVVTVSAVVAGLLLWRCRKPKIIEPVVAVIPDEIIVLKGENEG